MSVERCQKCGRERPDYITTAWCTLGVYCEYVPAPAATAATIEQRVEALEKDSHPPVDFSHLVERLERLERPVDSRDAIAWEIGHAAALRGDGLETNPFRRAGQ